MATTILITGASGLVGSHILLKLCQEGQSLRALARNPAEAEKQIAEVAACYGLSWDAFSPQVEFMQGDLLELYDIEKALEGITSVIHCAGFVSFSRKDCKSTQIINARVTADLVNVALEFPVKWFCHISSVAAIGDEEPEDITENLIWKQQSRHNCYALSKYEAEKEVWRGIEEGLNAVIFCPSVVTGPSGKPAQLSQVFNFLRKSRGWYVNGQAGYVDARDVADAVWLAYSRQMHGERYILNAQNLSNLSFLQSCAAAAGLPAPTKALPGFVLQIGGFLGSLMHWFKFRHPLPDRATVYALRGVRSYSSEKFKKASGMSYRPLDESLNLMAKQFMKNH